MRNFKTNQEVIDYCNSFVKELNEEFVSNKFEIANSEFEKEQYNFDLSFKMELDDNKNYIFNMILSSKTIKKYPLIEDGYIGNEKLISFFLYV